jgi:hypothetical protein
MDDGSIILVSGDAIPLVRSVISILDGAGCGSVHVGTDDLTSLGKDPSRPPCDGLIFACASVGERDVEMLRRLVRSQAFPHILAVVEQVSADFAVKLVEFHLAGCLRSPLCAEDLLPRVEDMIRQSRFGRAFRQAALQQQKRAEAAAAALAAMGQADASPPSVRVRTYLDVLSSQVAGIFDDIHHLMRAASEEGREQPLCRFFACPKLDSLGEAVEETIRVLEKTRRAFKSKDLADLRHKLLELIARDRKFPEISQDAGPQSDG